MIRNDKSILPSDFDEDDSNGWIVTFADLVSLLLVFFILMYTMSTIDLVKFKRIAESVKNNLGSTQIAPNPSVGSETIVENTKVAAIDIEQQMVMDEKKKILKDIRSMLKKGDLEGNVEANIIEGKITIRVRGRVLFGSGSAELKRISKRVLDGIIKIVSEYKTYIVNIKGHTDDVPIATKQFPSNWELSAIRATNVLKYLIAQGVDARRLTATGYGDVLPIVPNNTEKQRSKNRRIEFVLEKETR
ncbi:MAG: OmpA family protein [Nitrospinae bacterium]|nr:OmpA family protein [Nitrospinota bacterium]